MLLRYLWIAAAGFNLVAALLFFRRDLIRRLPIVWCWILSSGLRLIAILNASTQKEYSEIYILTAPFMIALSAGAVIELFSVATSQYKHFTRIGQGILGILAFIGVVLSGANQAVTTSNSWWLGSPVRFERMLDVVLATVLIGSWATIIHIGRKAPTAAKFAAAVMGAQLISGVLLSSMMGMGYRSFAVRVTLPILTSLAASMAWCLVPRWQEGDSPARNESALAAGAAGMDLRESRLRDAVSAVR